MDRDPLDAMLRRADQTAGAPRPAAGDLAARVRRRDDRRRRLVRATARSGGAAAAVFVLALALWQLNRPDGNPGAGDRVALTPVDGMTSADVAAMRHERDALERECAACEAAVARALDAGRRRQAEAATRRRNAPRADPLLELQWQRELAALTLVRQGDRFADELNLTAPAAVAYRQASDTFPGTRWADVACERLVRQN